jgi:hypothetical protein
MEALTNSSEDYLIDGLSFKLPPGSSYVLQRKGATFWASGSNTYTPTGTKVVRFQIAGEDNAWLDPSTVRFQFQLNNKEGAKAIVPLGGAYLFWNRCRILCAGQLAEDLQSYNRVHHMMSCLMNKDVRNNEDIEAFGYRFDDETNDSKTDATVNLNTMPGIPANSSKIVAFKIMSGLLSQDKMINIKFCPLVIEMELVSDFLEPLVTGATPGGSDAATILNSDHIGSAWEIIDCQIKCDICVLDNSLNNSYIEHLLSGKSLPLTYTTWITQQSSITTNQLAIQVSRSVSRLKKCYITFFNGGTGRWDKQCIDLSHPMSSSTIGGYLGYDKDLELQVQLSLGSSLFPEYPVRSIGECFKLLRQALNLPEYHQHSLSIKAKDYYKNHFIYAQNFERVQDSSYTGINTKAGQLLIVKVEAINKSRIDGTTNIIGQSMFITLESEQILEVRDGGCTIYD